MSSASQPGKEKYRRVEILNPIFLQNLWTISNVNTVSFVKSVSFVRIYLRLVRMRAAPLFLCSHFSFPLFPFSIVTWSFLFLLQWRNKLKDRIEHFQKPPCSRWETKIGGAKTGWKWDPFVETEKSWKKRTRLMSSRWTVDEK